MEGREGPNADALSGLGPSRDRGSLLDSPLRVSRERRGRSEVGKEGLREEILTLTGLAGPLDSGREGRKSRRKYCTGLCQRCRQMKRRKWPVEGRTRMTRRVSGE